MSYTKGQCRLPKIDEKEEARRKAAGQMTERQFRCISVLTEARFGAVNLDLLNKWSASRLIGDLKALRADAPLSVAFVKTWVDTGVLGDEYAPVQLTPRPANGPRHLGDLSWLKS